jgi:hypothetical protein
MPNRLLIAAGESASGAGQLPFGITALIDAADEILVVTPTLPSATDRATEQADQRLRTVLGQLAERGTDAEGVIGADDPLQAFEDAIREFEPDHLIIALRSGEDSDWQERGLLDQLQERFGVPMTAFSIAAGLQD